MNLAGLVQVIATLSWLLVIGLIALAVARAARSKNARSMVSVIVIAVVIAILLTTVSAGLVFIQPEERGVVVSALRNDSGGVRTEALQPGLRWVVPFAENVVLYPISRQTYTMSVAPTEGQVYGDDSIRARTRDGQEVFIDASVIYAIEPANVVDLHIIWQDRYTDELVRPTTRGIIRDAASQYGVEEIVSSKRVEMEQLITDLLTTKFAENDLILIDFVLRDIHFSDDYAAAVEQKQIAEQQAQQAAYVVESKKQEAEQARQEAQGLADAAVIAAKGAAEARLIQAEAEAKALELIAGALANNPDLLTYQYITKLAPNVQVMYLPADQPLLLPLPQP